MMLDLVCLYAAFLTAYFIRHGQGFSFENNLYRSVLIMYFFIHMLVCFFDESFKNVLKRGYYQEMRATIRHICLVMLGILTYLFLVQESGLLSRVTMMMTCPIYVVYSYIVRCLWKQHLKQGRTGTNSVRSLLILASVNSAKAIIDDIRSNNCEGFRVCGIALIDAHRIGDSIEGIPVVADLDTVVSYVCHGWVDEVFIDQSEEQSVPDKLIDNFIDMGVTVHKELARGRDKGENKQRVEKIGNSIVLTSSMNMVSTRQAFVKRAIDIAGGLVGCFCTLLIGLVVAPLIYIQSPGPVIFSQTRVGKNGKLFKVYKFRSMYLDAEERKKELMEQNRVKDGMMFKMDHDPRIIGGDHGIGGIIRKYSIDEFPQFWNVLKGDMSLVGTRPPTVDEWEKYELYHRSRMAIKPGITGMWQVSGRSSITDFEEVVRLDRAYITNWNIGMDFKIILKTVLVLFNHAGAM
jgi:exopolysaccharide biosynthesis polyprenyl glycosylphosphotransferase